MYVCVRARVCVHIHFQMSKSKEENVESIGCSLMEIVYDIFCEGGTGVPKIEETDGKSTNVNKVGYHLYQLLCKQPHCLPSQPATFKSFQLLIMYFCVLLAC